MKRSTFITWDQLRVGGIILAAIGVLSLAIFKLGEAANLFAPRYELTTFLGSAPGLREGGAVSVAGQLAGEIKEIDFLPVDGDTTRNLRVVMSLDTRLRDQIRVDSRAQVKNMGLLGDKVIDIAPGTVPNAILEPGDTLLVTPSIDYDEVIARASGAIGDVLALTNEMRIITTGIVRGDGTMGQLVNSRALYDQLVRTLATTNDAIARLQNSNGTLARLLDDPHLYDQLLLTLGTLDSVAMRVTSQRGTMGLLLSDSTLYRNMVGVTTEMRDLVKSVQSGDGTAARLIRDPAIYEHMTQTLSDFSALIADMQKNPKKYFKGLITVF